MPAPGSIDVRGLDLAPAVLDQLVAVDGDRWRQELPRIEAHYAFLGDRLPRALTDQLTVLEKRLAGG